MRFVWFCIVGINFQSKNFAFFATNVFHLRIFDRFFWRKENGSSNFFWILLLVLGDAFLILFWSILIFLINFFLVENIQLKFYLWTQAGRMWMTKQKKIIILKWNYSTTAGWFLNVNCCSSVSRFVFFFLSNKW